MEPVGRVEKHLATQESQMVNPEVVAAAAILTEGAEASAVAVVVAARFLGPEDF
jgi:hypothetical protein